MVMTANEINNHYRATDYESNQKLDFVLGIEIHRSRSAKCSCDLCDNMNGIYPKTFKFQGWCDKCKCFMTTIRLTGEEFTDFLLTGDVPEHLVVKTIPSKALEYIENNYDKLKGYYWVEELLKLNSE